MVLAPSVAGLFKWRQFEPEVILLAVGWYLRFLLSYRDVEELLAERGISVDHVTLWRWVQRYAPEIQRQLRPRLRPTNDSWRVDETYIRVKGKWVYLYRAVDSSGATIDFLLSAKRDAAAAERFLTKSLGGENHPAPRNQLHERCAGTSGRGFMQTLASLYELEAAKRHVEEAFAERQSGKADSSFLNNAPKRGEAIRPSVRAAVAPGSHPKGALENLTLVRMRIRKRCVIGGL